MARRSIFRPSDAEDWGRVADRVAAGSLSLHPDPDSPAARIEQARLRNAIACGAVLASGRQLQHGDATQAGRAMELFTNCATAITSFALFYLLLNGAGVGRAYDEELVLVDWAGAPDLHLLLDPAHPDHPGAAGAEAALFTPPAALPAHALRHVVEDSREGWAKAVELLEGLAFAGAAGRCLAFDLSAIRPRGAPIAGLQGRPAPGPLALARALHAIREQVIAPRRAGLTIPPWEQALRIDHALAAAVSAGGVRRAARMASKNWQDQGARRFVRLAASGAFWTANHSLMVDRRFWALIAPDAPPDPLRRHARALFAAATRAAWRCGEPGFLNGDRLEDWRTGAARARPPATPPWASRRYRTDAAAGLIGALGQRAAAARFPATTNPCGEVVLHVAGGYCVVGDVAPLLACPAPLEEVPPGCPDPALAAAWDERVAEALRLGVRMLLRLNRMDGLYAEEVRRTNRIGIGLTGIHEWAWLRFGLDFPALLDAEGRAARFWAEVAALSALAKREALESAAAMGQAPPLTITTIKPSGTTAKLFGLSEGAHLPARRRYLRWVQFRADDPAAAELAAAGHPRRPLSSRPDTVIIGFPVEPLILRLGIGERLVTAAEASPEQHYAWLALLERHWIGAERGNQVSYTLPLDTTRCDLARFRGLLRRYQPGVRAAAIMPLRPAESPEYLPEEELPETAFAALCRRLRGPARAGAEAAR
ncbi:MAG: recombinase [Rhodovarius sp.]|nr:recombinase [Rhodovarius sp.]MDW8315101.1 recombinase [Rhodovarius sp.]